jgi:hypothetical protein
MLGVLPASSRYHRTPRLVTVSTTEASAFVPRREVLVDPRRVVRLT